MKNFQQNLKTLEAADTQVLGVSMDSWFSNKAFADQIGVTFPLLSCLVPRHSLQFVSTHPLQVCSSIKARKPALDRGRALASEIQFADYGATVVHQHPLSDPFQLHPFSG